MSPDTVEGGGGCKGGTRGLGPNTADQSGEWCGEQSKSVLCQLSLPPSPLPHAFLSPPPALCVCVTPLRERACTGTLGPSIHKRRGWRSRRRAQGSKHCVRGSGTPIGLCNPGTDAPLFLLKLAFHSTPPPATGLLCRGAEARAQGWAMMLNRTPPSHGFNLTLEPRKTGAAPLPTSFPGTQLCPTPEPEYRAEVKDALIDPPITESWRGVERTHLPRYYCQSIIQGNARRAPRGRVHYALTTGSVLVSKPPRVIGLEGEGGREGWGKEEWLVRAGGGGSLAARAQAMMMSQEVWEKSQNAMHG
ncbi:unnamed protein product [Pleuronectes platessa]|uniref:Uncharacterized protein n=1 Tax=Pleuronectes platessa TaxID=8262 RepID=A0A9N7YM07_PLEPL|nr:unnamed protein product [Pleuronectes platessa]